MNFGTPSPPVSDHWRTRICHIIILLLTILSWPPSMYTRADVRSADINETIELIISSRPIVVARFRYIILYSVQCPRVKDTKIPDRRAPGHPVDNNIRMYYLYYDVVNWYSIFGQYRNAGIRSSFYRSVLLNSTPTIITLGVRKRRVHRRFVIIRLDREMFIFYSLAVVAA